MRPINRRKFTNRSKRQELQPNVTYQAEIVDIEDLNDEESEFFTIIHRVNVSDSYTNYPEKFYGDTDNRRVKELLDRLAPFGVTGDNLGDAIGFREEITMVREFKPGRGRSYLNIGERQILGPKAE